MKRLKLWFAAWTESLRRARRDRQRERQRKFREKCDLDYKMKVEDEQWKARIWAKEMKR